MSSRHPAQYGDRQETEKDGKSEVHPISTRSRKVLVTPKSSPAALPVSRRRTSEAVVETRSSSSHATRAAATAAHVHTVMMTPDTLEPPNQLKRKMKTQQSVASLPPSQSKQTQHVEDQQQQQQHDSSHSRASPPWKIAKTDKAYKGLRHFSMMVCKKVEEKGTTTYNEVADELVLAVLSEGMNPRGEEDDNLRRTTIEQGKGKSAAVSEMKGKKMKQQIFDEKNIRRRVYDALNVLMAMDIIQKNKKEITWNGLPTTFSQDVIKLKRDIEFRTDEIVRKRTALHELLIQQICFRNLCEMNYHREQQLREGQSQKRSPQQSPDKLSNEQSSIDNDRSLTDSQKKKPYPPIQVSSPRTRSKSKMLSQHDASHTTSSVAFSPPSPPATSKDNRDPEVSKAKALPTTTAASADVTSDSPNEKKLDNKIPLPFIVVNTNASAVIQCNMSRDLTDVMFDFSMPFEINDDNTILKRLNLHKTTELVLERMLPNDFIHYCKKHNLLEDALVSPIESPPRTKTATSPEISSQQYPPYLPDSSSTENNPFRSDLVHPFDHHYHQHHPYSYPDSTRTVPMRKHT